MTLHVRERVRECTSARRDRLRCARVRERASAGERSASARERGEREGDGGMGWEEGGVGGGGISNYDNRRILGDVIKIKMFAPLRARAHALKRARAHAARTSARCTHSALQASSSARTLSSARVARAISSSSPSARARVRRFSASGRCS